jgi:hypothetical protein
MPLVMSQKVSVTVNRACELFSVVIVVKTVRFSNVLNADKLLVQLTGSIVQTSD